MQATESGMDTQTMPMKLEARYAYYRRCQQVMRSGAQCRCPAQKGTAICRKHEEQEDLAQRRMKQQQDVLLRAAEKISRDTGARHSTETLFGSPRGLQVLLSETMQAVAHDRLDDKGAREMLTLLQAALFRTRGLQARRRGMPLPRMRSRGVGRSAGAGR